jgi:predicted signal transduction protein with EAL and GGDEF domain
LRLQRALSRAEIGYRHHPELAPTTELRQLQYAEDARQGVGKRSRVELAPAYRQGYTRQILDRADLELLVSELPERGTASLFCVEADPKACHRSIVAERLHTRHGIEVVHLQPPS